MAQYLPKKKLNTILQAENINELSYVELRQLFQKEMKNSKFISEGVCAIDPRNGDRIIYNTARAQRPHDNRPPAADVKQKAEPGKECVICEGNTTGIIDVTSLSEGYTFINKNLFPIVFPSAKFDPEELADPLVEHYTGPQKVKSHGFHFIQWTSSYHDKDWQNMPLADRIIVMKRLAALEKKMLAEFADEMIPTQKGFVSIIKNYGASVGGSLSHGHQQVIFSNIMPRRFRDNLRFELKKGQPFVDYIVKENPPELLLRDYGKARLIIPYFMRRPFYMMLVVKDVKKRYLYDLGEAEIKAVAEGWHDAIYAIRTFMPKIGRETAYNVITHNGPAAGLYFEFLPRTQETGGFEHLGLFSCQSSPRIAASFVKKILKQKVSRPGKGPA